MTTRSLTAVDLFAGIGGTTHGARAAGYDVLHAANHNPVAVANHHLNQPTVPVQCQDLHQADFTLWPSHDVLLGSPCCQGHSNARGKDKPQHDASRATAWAMVACAEVHQPRVAVVENVPEFSRWRLFPAWAMAWEALGYTLTQNTIDAADCGVPQHRVRTFFVASREGPISIAPGTADHKAARSVITLDHPDASWSPLAGTAARPRAQATLDRVARGREQLGTDTFLAPYYSEGSGLTGRSLDRPIGTLTRRDRYALVDGDRLRCLTVDEQAQLMGFPAGIRFDSTRKDAVEMLGNAVCPPVAAHVLSQVAEHLRN